MFTPLLSQAADGGAAGAQGSTSTLLLLISSSGITAVIVAIITAIVNRRKLSAEATNIISQAAGGVVERLETENKRLNSEVSGLRKRIADLELIENKRKDQDASMEDQLRLHRQYDLSLIARLADLGVTVEPPPSFILPR